MLKKYIADLEQENRRLLQSIELEEKNQFFLEKQLGSVFNSKAYVVWQRYNRYKKIFVGQIRIGYLHRMYSQIVVYTKRILMSIATIILNQQSKFNYKFNTVHELINNKSQQAEVSILIPTYGSISNLERLIKSFKDNPDQVNKEILFINDNPSNISEMKFWINNNLGSIKKLKISIYSNSINQGFVNSINSIAKKASGKYILLLNDDTELIMPQSISKLADCFTKKEIAIVGNLLLFPDKMTVQHGGMHPFQKNDGKIYNYHFFKFFNKNFPELNFSRMVPMVTGASMMIKKDIFFELGGLDNKYLGAGGFDDSDICNQAVSHGYKIKYCPQTAMIHHEGTTIKKLTYQHQICFINNHNYYQNKWHNFLLSKYPEFMNG